MPAELRSNVILFDGICNLCNGWVNFVLDRDPSGVFSFAPQQSAAGRAILRARGLSADEVATIVLVTADHVYLRSSAILYVCARLKGPWRFLGVLAAIPRPVRDFVYEQIARHRYAWFGKSDSCRLPTPDIERRFIT